MRRFMLGSIMLHFGGLWCAQQGVDLTGLGRNLQLAMHKGMNDVIFRKLQQKYQTTIDHLYDKESQGFSPQHESGPSLNWKQCAHPLGSFALGLYLMRASQWLDAYDRQRKKNHIPPSIRLMIWSAGAYNSISSLYRFWLLGKCFWGLRVSGKMSESEQTLNRDKFTRAFVAGLFIYRQAYKKNNQQVQRQMQSGYSCSPVVYYGPNVMMNQPGFPVITHNQAPTTQPKITEDSDDEG